MEFLDLIGYLKIKFLIKFRDPDFKGLEIIGRETFSSSEIATLKYFHQNIIYAA